MSKTQYAGIDYTAPGSTVNRDLVTGIRYGVISQNSISPEAMDDLFNNSTDLSYEAGKEELTTAILTALTCGDGETAQEEALNYALSDLYGREREKQEEAVSALLEVWNENAHDDPPSEADKEAVWEEVEEEFNGSYNGDDHDWAYEGDGYKLTKCLQSDIFVLGSPFYTYAQFCSPCVPGAGNLDSLFDGTPDEAEKAGFPKVFCLGHDWFEDGEAPYPVFRVDTGKQVVMRSITTPCPNCNGSGKDTLKRIAEVRGVSETSILIAIDLGKQSFPTLKRMDENGNYIGQFHCGRCDGKGFETNKVEEEI